jgi:hypothetical protein
LLPRVSAGAVMVQQQAPASALDKQQLLISIMLAAGCVQPVAGRPWLCYLCSGSGQKHSAGSVQLAGTAHRNGR